MNVVAGRKSRAYDSMRVLVTPSKADIPPRQRGFFVPHAFLHGEDAPTGNGGRPDFRQVTNILPANPLEVNYPALKGEACDG